MADLSLDEVMLQEMISQVFAKNPNVKSMVGNGYYDTQNTVGAMNLLLWQPLDYYARVDDSNHDLPEVRDVRICASDNDGRSARLCVRVRKTSTRRLRSFASATAFRIRSAMTALLFCPQKVLSNSALTSSGTLKLVCRGRSTAGSVYDGVDLREIRRCR